MGCSPFRGRSEWELFYFYFLFLLIRGCLQSALSFEHTLCLLTHAHTRTLLKAEANHPTDFAMCCCSPSLSANMRLLALCLAQVTAQASLMVGVIF